MQFLSDNVQPVALWHLPCKVSWQRTIPPFYTGLLQRSHPRMYLLFVPAVLAFVGIFAITLRNQFAERTNL
jgi:hypothetical protein